MHGNTDPTYIAVCSLLKILLHFGARAGRHLKTLSHVVRHS